MLLTILGFLIAMSISAGLAFLIAKKIYTQESKNIINQAQIKANAIEKEAEILLQNQKLALKEEEFALKSNLEQEKGKFVKDYEDRLKELEKKELVLEQKIEKINKDSNEIARKHNILISEQEKIEDLKEKYKEKKDELISVLSNYSALSKEEAKSMLLTHLEDNLITQKANLIRRFEQENKEEIKKRANYIIALATSRYAGEYSAEKLINVVHLPDEMKGRIIGKDGRNIRALELITGVDILIDDTPNSIVLSSFNLYRRAIALRAINRLIEDGRINPAKIEETYKKCESEMEQEILSEGEHVVLDLGLGYMHEDLKKLIGKMKYRASYGQNALSHSKEVAFLSGLIAGELDGDEILARRAGLLHDIGKSLTQEMGGNHVSIGYELAQKYKEHPVVSNAILAHHGNEEAKSIEAAAVCTADIISGARPGARREVLENFLKRVQNLEKIALNHIGVKEAYAINAGREIRVIVKSDMINDKEAIVLARNIAQEIELNLQYPGEIKVNVIREVRATQFAR